MYGSSVQPSAPAASAGPPQSALDAYMANYGARLQSMLSSGAGGGALGGNPVMYQEPTSSLGPDMYQGYQVGEGARFMPQGRPAPAAQPSTGGAAGAAGAAAPPAAAGPASVPRAAPQESALAPSATAQQRPALANGGGNSGGAPRSALAGSNGPARSSASNDSSGEGNGQRQGGKPYSFRDLWNNLSSKERKQQTDELAQQLKAGEQTINSAYSTMMQQLGTRPSTKLSREDKGMLLMEFGLRMMQHSASPAQGGFGANFGAAAGAAGAETMQQAFGLRQQKQQQAYNYDRLQQQAAMAHGRDLANLQSRSVLEAGRDYRAMNREDALMNRAGLMQEGAGERQQSALEARESQFDRAESGRNQRAADAQAGANARNKARINAPGKGRGAAAQSNYQLYMDTYGHDANGNALTGPALERVKQSALTFASNPHAFAMSDAQATQLAQSSTDRFFAANKDNYLGMKPQDLQVERQRIFQETKQRLLRNGNAGLPREPQSALAPAGTTPPAGTAPPAALAYLRAHPEAAPQFKAKYGYLPGR